MITGIAYITSQSGITYMRDAFYNTKIRACSPKLTYDIYDIKYKCWCFAKYNDDYFNKVEHIWDTLL